MAYILEPQNEIKTMVPLKKTGDWAVPRSDQNGLVWKIILPQNCVLSLFLKIKRDNSAQLSCNWDINNFENGRPSQKFWKWKWKTTSKGLKLEDNPIFLEKEDDLKNKGTIKN